MLDTNKIEELREKTKLTQEQLAQKIDMSTYGYTQSLKRNDFKASYLTKIARALNVTEAYFFKEEKIDKKPNIYMINEPINVYGKIECEEFHSTVISQLSTIIEILNKK